MRLGNRKAAKVLDNGIVLTDSAEFHEIAAVNVDGQVYLVAGNRYNRCFTETLGRLIDQGIVPNSAWTNQQAAEPETIKSLYGEARAHLSASPGGTDATLRDTALIKLDKVLSDAAAARASDVKFFQDEARTTIRIKVAGREFSSSMNWTVSEGISAMATLFDARDEGTGESTAIVGKFQSFSVSPGKAQLRLPGGVVKLRGQRGFHEVDSGLGGHTVLRLFYSDEAQQATSTLESLGFDDEVSSALAVVRAKLAGGIIIAGATGDGKSTTLIRCLQKLYSDHHEQISIVTVEDPVEYRIRGDGILQIPVRSSGSAEERTKAFRQALMHFVRINPDVGAISEIRDASAATEALQFVDTGHQVWTTIHGSTANGILFRLIEMGIQAEELCKPGSIEVLMKQTLAPLLCLNCALPFLGRDDPRKPVIGRQLEDLEIGLEGLRVRNREGCSLCRPGTDDPVARAAWCGYRRQVAVAEVIHPDEGYFERVRRRDSFEALDYWTTPAEAGGLGGTPLSAKMAGLVGEGVLDPFDAVRKNTDFAAVDKTLIPGHRVTSLKFRAGAADRADKLLPLRAAGG